MHEIWYYSIHGVLGPVTFSEEDLQVLLERDFDNVGIYFFASLVSN